MWLNRIPKLLCYSVLFFCFFPFFSSFLPWNYVIQKFMVHWEFQLEYSREKKVSIFCLLANVFERWTLCVYSVRTLNAVHSMLYVSITQWHFQWIFFFRTKRASLMSWYNCNWNCFFVSFTNANNSSAQKNEQYFSNKIKLGKNKKTNTNSAFFVRNFFFFLMWFEVKLKARKIQNKKPETKKYFHFHFHLHVINILRRLWDALAIAMYHYALCSCDTECWIVDWY